MSEELLLIVDPQNDFCPGGALAVPGGDEIFALINKFAGRFEHIAITQDWHPAGHASFASSHPGKQPFETIELSYGTQVLWPDHCVQGTSGAALHHDLDVSRAQLIVRKGFHANIDSYSAFFENDRKTPTGLGGYLRERGIEKLFLCGLATDFCVNFSALDAVAEGFEVVVFEDACRAIDLDGSLAAAKTAMLEAGVEIRTTAP